MTTATSTRPKKGAFTKSISNFSLLTFGLLLLLLGSNKDADDDLDNRPKHSEGISCRPKEACEGLESEERQRQFKCVYGHIWNSSRCLGEKIKFHP